MKHQLQKEDELRKSVILNVILSGSLVLAFTASIVNLFAHPTPQYPILEILPGITLVFLYGLYILSKHISSNLAALSLIGVASFLGYYLAYKWGTVIPHSWIILALTVVMGGILVSSRFSLFLVTTHSIVLFALTYLQTTGSIVYDHWGITPTFGSVLVTIVILGVISLISWLSNQEIEKALHRARGSEKALKKERNLLEIKVEERTKELKRAQLEKVSHLYRLADFGRMAAGLFHDLANPLTTVSLNLEQLQTRATATKQGRLTDTRLLLRRAINGTKRMESFVQAVRKQIQKQEEKGVFSLNREITQALDVLNHKAKSIHVKLHFVYNKTIHTYGNSLRFNQLITNLVSNAIEAYEKTRRRKNRKVIIKLSSENGKVTLVVQDFGFGIPKGNLKKIFDPFFTTKSIDKGTGMGLFICKDIVEEGFGGKIEIESKEGEWTTATVDFPIRQHGH